MKKAIVTILSILMSLSLAACSSNESTSKSKSVGKIQSQGKVGQHKILIAYFTMPETDGVDTVASASRVVVDGKVFGNTQFIAKNIQSSIGGDLFAIETVQKYPGSHDPLLKFAYNEKSENARPELSKQIENVDDYDVIFIGNPIWNADLPMPLYTFLEKYDLRGKTIVPFGTNGGSGFADTIKTIEKLQPNATVVKDGFTVSRNSVARAENDVRDWAKDLNLAN